MAYRKLDVVNRYLPRTLIDRWQRYPDQNPVWGEWLTGSLMHCDVTGFTAMSEVLAKAGNEGAELMAGILNRFFDHMLGIAGEWGGIQMKFGGDAMLLYFHGDEHAHHAAACALEMQSGMKEYRDIQVFDDSFTLRMRIGIHSGEFYSASVGQDAGLLHYILIGDDVNKTADVEPKAEPGQVVISTQTKQLLNDQFQINPTQEADIWLVNRHKSSSQKPGNPHSLICSNQNLHRYLMPPIVEEKVSNLSGEHRRVTVVFVYLHGTSQLLKEKGETIALQQVNQYLNFVFESMEKFGGYLITSDVSEHGDKLLVTFGAPVSKGEQENNALSFSCELLEKLASSDLDLQQQIGINSGYVFAGEIGSNSRREYTTIGDTTNLSARLMGTANRGEIIVSAKTYLNSSKEFIATELEPVRVKGKSQPISIFRVDSIKPDEQVSLTRDSASPLFGRDKELSLLKETAKECQNGNTQGIYVSGESGIGKSRLLHELMLHLGSSGWVTLTGICQSYSTNKAYSAWYYPLRKLFDISLQDNDDSTWQKITSFVQTTKPDLEVFCPLIAEILASRYVDNPVVKSLDSKTRREKRIYAIVELLKAKSAQSPIALYFDNAQWLDSSSSELFNAILISKNTPVLVCLSSRLDLEQWAGENTPSFSELQLQQLADDAADELLKFRQVSDVHAKKIIQRAKGNPLFLEELAKSALDENRELPETVYDVVMSRLDDLDAIKKSLLKNASVLGQIFDSNLLTGLVEDIKDLSHGKR